MLILRRLVQDGIVPLLGPPTSIGDVHHGAWYYYLLSPAAALTGGDQPLAVVALIALAGILAVGVVWWLARAIAGPVAGLVAGLVLATSAAAIDESTFIWNPNLIALSSAVALAAAWRAWTGHDARWWVVAAIGTAVTMQCHILGVALLPVVGVPFLLDHRRRGRMGRVPLAIVAVFALAYLPLILNELTRGFSEVAAASAYLTAGGSGADVALPIRFVIVLLRVVSWPLTGLIIDGLAAAALVTVVTIAIVAWRWGARDPGERLATRWLGLGLLWSVAFLTLAAPSLAGVVRGLPNDHYHAFADPMVVVLIGIGVAALVREVRAPIGPLAAGVAVAALVGWNLAHVPPATNPDGGYPAAEQAAARVDAALTAAGISRDDVVALHSLPTFKSSEAMAYPLVRLGRRIQAATPDGLAPGDAYGSIAPPAPPLGLVVLCDALFRASIDGDCGGTAEAPVPPALGVPDLRAMLDRFEVAPGRWVTVFGPRATDPRYVMNRERRRPRRRRSLSPRPGRWRATRVVPWKFARSGRVPGRWCA